jgi:hypothetical protein
MPMRFRAKQLIEECENRFSWRSAIGFSVVLGKRRAVRHFAVSAARPEWSTTKNGAYLSVELQPTGLAWESALPPFALFSTLN